MGLFKRDPKGIAGTAVVVSYGRGRQIGEEAPDPSLRTNIKPDVRLVDPADDARRALP